MKKSIGDIFKEGILTNNPIFMQLLGICPALAVTTSVMNAISMGVILTIVLTFSNLLISLLRRLVPYEVRIPTYIIIISGLVTAAELLTKAFFPMVDMSLGLFIPLIAVNCIVLTRAEAFASENGPIPSLIDGIATGIGFTFALVCTAAVRELLGTGMIFASLDGTGGIRIFGDWFSPVAIFLMPAGAFLTLGFLAALAQKIRYTAEERRRARMLEADAIENGNHATLMKDPETGKIVRRRAVIEEKTVAEDASQADSDAAADDSAEFELCDSDGAEDAQ